MASASPCSRSPVRTNPGQATLRITAYGSSPASSSHCARWRPTVMVRWPRPSCARSTSRDRLDHGTGSRPVGQPRHHRSVELRRGAVEDPRPPRWRGPPRRRDSWTATRTARQTG